MCGATGEDKEGINPSGLVKYLGQNLKILEFWILEIWDLEEFERTCTLYLARRVPCKQGAADSIDGGQRPGHRRPMILGPCDL